MFRLTVCSRYGLLFPKFFGIPAGNVKALGMDVNHARNAVAHLMEPPLPDIIVLDQVRASLQATLYITNLYNK